jgi:hypothetical protein
MAVPQLFGILDSSIRSNKTERLTISTERRIERPGIAPAGASDLRALQVARERLQTAAGALRTALTALRRHEQPVFSTTTTISRTVATVAGRGPDSPVEVEFQQLETTRPINTRTTSERASTAAINLREPAGLRQIVSTGEMNSGVVTSYKSTSLRFTSGSSVASSVGTLSGTYAGTGKAEDATALTVRVTRNAALQTSRKSSVAFEVTNDKGKVLFAYDGKLAAGESVYLGNDIGLSLSFSSGSIKSQQRATTEVTRTPITVSTTAAFNATLGPRFEDGMRVTEGSFTVNGVAIAVHANDSIASVLNRINASGAGVRATAGEDKVTIVAASRDSHDSIVLAHDTSGFLAATKLAGAATDIARVPDNREVLAKTKPFKHVNEGSFRVNGRTIAVDPHVDSLNDVLARVTTAGAGVVARYEDDSDTVIFTPDDPAAALTIDGDTTGFLAAAKITAGTTSTRINADAPFNAVGAAGPLFDPGVTVKAGSFTVNNTAIHVAAGDSVSSVLEKISSSDAGVTATLHAETQTIELQAMAWGMPPITVGNDTSGFLAAVKLDAATLRSTEKGSYPSYALAIADVPEFEHVKAGALTINGHSVSIAPRTMSLEDVVSRLDHVPRVEVRLDKGAGSVVVASQRKDELLEIVDTSGLFAALGIANGTYHGRAETPQTVVTQTGTTVVSNAKDVASRASHAAKQLNDALGTLAFDRVADQAAARALTDALQAGFDTLRDRGLGGLTVAAEHGQVRVVADEGELAASLEALPHGVDVVGTFGAAIYTWEDAVSDAVAAAQRAAPPAQTISLEEPAGTPSLPGTTVGNLFLRPSSSGTVALKAYLHGKS